MNIRIGIFGFLFGLVTLFAGFPPPSLYGEDGVYTVQRGDTFYSIARNLGIKADDLMKYNGITDPSRLLAGQRLKIPGSAAAGGFESYRVVRGDTFYGIARKFAVTEKQIREANSLPDSYVLREGDSLRIPQKAGTVAVNVNPVAAAVSVRPSGTESAAQETKMAIPQVTWPVAAREFSYMTGKLSGVVITGARAESVKSLTWGTVLSAGPYRGFGNVAIIQVEGGYLYVYGGCESLSVKEGDKVGPGTELGKLGIDMVSAKPQLFFMVYRSNAPVDPARAPRA